jgi:hypothetical protein
LKFLTKYADNTRKGSIVNKWRRKRFAVFTQLIKDLPRPIKILDAGGTENFWVQMGFTESALADIVILNEEKITVSFANFKYIQGDARDLGAYKDNEFDVVFSNSVIEHVGGFRDQQKMADEVMRVGKTFFVQTPNYYFPIEPHFLFPFFQFLPLGIKIFLVRNFRLGWFSKCGTRDEAEALIGSISLLKEKELKKLFPSCKIMKEKLLFITKSFMVIPQKP